MAIVAVGVEFNNRRPRLVVSTFEGGLRHRPHLINVLTISLFPIYAKSLRALRQTFVDNGRTVLARAHRILVVFDDVDDRKVEKGCHIEAFVKTALVNCAVPEETQ